MEEISQFEKFRYPEGEKTPGPHESTHITDSSGTEYEIYKLRHFDNAFEFQSEELKEIFQGVDPGNTACTPEMHSYVPPEAVIVYGNFKSRLIFYDQKFHPEEVELLDKFKALCKSKGVRVPDCDPEILKTLYTSKFDINKAFNMLQQKVEWVNTKFPYRVGPTEFDLLNSGILEVLGRDRNYRPILLVRAWKIDAMDVKPTPETMIATALIMQEFITKHMMIPGKIENTIFILDIGGQGILNIPLSLIKPMIQTLMMNYKCRVRTQFMLRASFAFNMLFQAVSIFLDYNTKMKIQMTTENTHPTLQDLVSPNQLPVTFGGTCKDREEGEYWPPQLPDMNFGVEGYQKKDG